MGSNLNGKNIEDSTITEEKINGGFPPGGGASISNVNDLANLLKNTTLKAISTWDTIDGAYFSGTTSVPFKSPDNPPPFFTDADFIYEIVQSEFPPTETAITIINFGKDRGNTINHTITESLIPYIIKAYFQWESYPTGGTFYKTTPVTGSFIVDLP